MNAAKASVNRLQYEKTISKEVDDELRPEYHLSQLKGGVRAKYYKQAIAPQP